MIRDPEIAALRTDLERLGVVVAPHSDHLCVRLPLFAAVRVRLDEGNLRCDPIFGPLPRTTDLLLTLGGLTALVGGLFYVVGSTPAALIAGFAGVMIAAAQVCRFVLTEGCITRVQLLWAARMGGRRGDMASVSPPPLTPSLRALEVPPPDPDLNPPQRLRTERKR
jgi:hypothetical protein